MINTLCVQNTNGSHNHFTLISIHFLNTIFIRNNMLDVFINNKNILHVLHDRSSNGKYMLNVFTSQCRTNFDHKLYRNNNNWHAYLCNILADHTLLLIFTFIRLATKLYIYMNCNMFLCFKLDKVHSIIEEKKNP